MKGNESPLKNMEWLVKLMDSQFSIPGTKIRFGLDAIIGLIPGGGDFASFIVSAVMLSTFAQKGASGYLLARMTTNIVIDALIGAIPLIGDIFDVAFRANERNLKLMKEHYIEGKHTGSAARVVVPLLLILLIVLGLIGWLSYKLISWIINSI
jgi:hypothetical protein